jgi:partner of Y14 and mago protein
VPGAEGLKGSNPEEKLGNAASKNAKRREARKKAKASESDGGEEVQVNGAERSTQYIAKSKAEAVNDWRAAAKNPEQALDAEAEKEKQARNLKKKLRQARELGEKKDKGENLLPEQFEKVMKLQELIRQLDSLGFDAEGEKKPKVDG